MVKAMSTEPTTPLMKTGSKNAELSPSTPHRIELRSDSAEDVKVVEKITEPTVKSKKRVKKGCLFPNGKEIKSADNHKLTEYFPVRRSVRKTTKIVLEEKQKNLEQALKSEYEEGLEVRVFEGKGRGVVASKDFSKGDFVVEYSGDLIDPIEAKLREEIYARNDKTGCYMYYFKYNNQQYCVDATIESGKLGRLVNHSRNGNLVTKTILIDNKPRLVLLAKNNIRKGEELLYDYGDRSKESLKHHPWLAY
ncbi:histone-lysine N-methyltransferase PR-Set7-like [Diorhabda carinulata]|uniref:histone-lysine N-methyltransferase PR-Set7-like n=1 Tax=Diorhabda carinulata TaxID=1163345 RepID=UPI0025A010E0|nr:histone-lysine N-methyltransferase PR-Set7-like [Diorhabda carinulata]